MDLPMNTTTTSTGLTEGLTLGIVKICLFSTFFILGLIGNSLVLVGIGLNKGMQTPTNLLIFNLALADILFIIVCIPTTLFSFFGRWPFTNFGCKLAQFINHLSAFMSIYLLVFMSIDRYVAVVHAIDSFAIYRTTKNTTICIMFLWFIGITISIPIGSLFTVMKFEAPISMYCLLRYLQPDPSSSLNNTETEENMSILPLEASLYWLGFVIFLYALPLTIIVILYGLMLKFLRGARGQSVGRSKRRATRMILAVILTYAFCWFFMQLLFVSNVVLSRNTDHSFATYMDILTMFANIFAYLNSCTNPILYGFMSKNFRSSFVDLLCCRYTKRHFFPTNESLRSRVIPHETPTRSFYQKSDYFVRTSVVTRISQLTPVATALALKNSSSLSRLAAELNPMYLAAETTLLTDKITTDEQCSMQLELNESKPGEVTSLNEGRRLD